MSSIILTATQVVHTVVTFFTYLLLARVILSWIRPNPDPGMLRNLLQSVYGVTDPVLTRVRTLLPFLVIGGLDLTPIALLFGLQLTESVLVSALYTLA